MSDISKTLAEGERTHGNFVYQAEISQTLSAVMRRAANYMLLTPYQRESLEMIQLKIARILEGDRNHPDHWHDIAGYATLVERHLRQEQERLQAKAAEYKATCNSAQATVRRGEPRETQDRAQHD